jgi:hypothetical protein
MLHQQQELAKKDSVHGGRINDHFWILVYVPDPKASCFIYIIKNIKIPVK